MTSPIGFEMPEDDEDFEEELEDDNVGEGCASLTPITDMDHVGGFVEWMRELGAVYVHVGDIEVRFPPDKGDAEKTS